MICTNGGQPFLLRGNLSWRSAVGGFYLAEKSERRGPEPCRAPARTGEWLGARRKSHEGMRQRRVLGRNKRAVRAREKLGPELRAIFNASSWSAASRMEARLTAGLAAAWAGPTRQFVMQDGQCYEKTNRCCRVAKAAIDVANVRRGAGFRWSGPAFAQPGASRPDRNRHDVRPGADTGGRCGKRRPNCFAQWRTKWHGR